MVHNTYTATAKSTYFLVIAIEMSWIVRNIILIELFAKDIVQYNSYIMFSHFFLIILYYTHVYNLFLQTTVHILT